MRCPQGFFFSTLLLFVTYSSFSQDRCATVRYEEQQTLKNPKRESIQQFEYWLKQKLDLRTMEAKRTQDTKATYVIPVVVHVIHNGEPVGTGSNLSEAQIASQIEVLNRDFQRLNNDASNTPANFLPVAGSIDIQFVLAKQDPIGAPSNGIVRVKGTQTSWSVNDNSIFKSLSYWPAEKYLNVWVVKFSDETLGYAQLPISNLGGLEGSPDDRLTDGVVIDNSAFGSIDFGSFPLDNKYNKGRTVTHEVGHFFGLRHIWGDDGSACTETDFVDDTPNQAGSYINQCPTGSKSTCSSEDMYMNYMDYTNDACMNMFTLGQMGRVNIVIQNSPRRASLLNSIGASNPTPVGVDGAISKIITPGGGSCGDAITPAIQIQNLGTNAISSVSIQLKVNNTIVETKNISIALAYLQFGEIPFNPVIPTSNSLLFNFEILQVNGVTDGRSFNNTSSVTTTIPPLVSVPISINFNTLPSNWTVYNPDNLVTWALSSTVNNGNALSVNSFDYDNQGAIDQIISPVLDLTNVTFAYLKFDRAYEYYGAGFEERLRVLVSTTCNFNGTPSVVFDKSGLALATTSASTGDSFTPSANDWKTEVISLSQFIGSKIQISFEAINGYGNNQFIDNIAVSTDQFTDIAIVGLDSPSPVSCILNRAPSLRVKNLGSTPITNFKLQTTVNSQNASTQTISNLNILPGEEQSFSLNAITLQSGSNSIVCTLSEPNSLIDSNPEDNSATFKRVINASKDIIPLRQNFESNFQSTWSIVSQGQEEVWTTTQTNKGTSLAFTAFNNQNLGEESWLVSPVIDLSRTQKASLFFDHAYASNGIAEDRLRVLYSEDCGVTFQSILFSESGATLSTAQASTSWTPAQESDWRRNFIDLTNLTGQSNLRFAFVATAENGNNQYLDNIEFFIDDNANPITLEDQYSVYGSLEDFRATFNLSERQPVELRIYNTMGQLILNNTLPETLNQTYYFNIGYQATGIYIVKVQFGDTVSASRIFLSR